MEVRGRILKIAEELFLKFGIRGITMDEIASTLGISKKTIYLHFEDKDAIVHEVALFRMNCEQEICKQICSEAENPVHEVVKEIEMMKTHAIMLNPVVMYDLKKYYPKTWAIFQQHKQTIFLDITKRNLQEGIKEGFYRPEINVDILSRLRMEEIDFAFDQNIFPTTKFNQIEVHKSFIDHFLRGILTEKGWKIYEQYIKTENIDVTR